MRVLLVNPAFRRRVGNIWRYISGTLPPLGLAHIAACLEREGIAVDIFDAHALNITRDGYRGYFEGKKYDLIGITSTSAMFRSAVEASEELKSIYPDALLVMGGVHPTVMPEQALAESSVDIVVAGEGEMTFVELARGANPSEVPGVVRRVDGEIVSNPPRPLIKNLDELPHPAWHLLPVKRYHPAVGGYHRLPAVHTLTSRGCPNACTYCYHIFGRGVRFRSVSHIMDELKILVKRHGVREVYFYDDTFNANPKRVEALCNAMLEEELDLGWSCLGRLEKMTLELLALMKRAGCHAITYGLETTDPVVLKAINKKLDVEVAEKIIADTIESGIETRVAFMMGNPGETRAAIERNIEYTLECGAHMTMFNIATPYPGTRMFEEGVAQGCITDFDWEHYDFSTPILEVPGLDARYLKETQKKAHMKYFMRPSYFWMRAKRINNLIDLKNVLLAFMSISGIFTLVDKVSMLLSDQNR